jgi:hypothetical protein
MTRSSVDVIRCPSGLNTTKPPRSGTAFWWQKTYADNIAYRHLPAETDVPVHGRVLPLAQVMQDIERMTNAAQDVCTRTQTVGVFMPGCPVKTPAAIGDGPPAR